MSDGGPPDPPSSVRGVVDRLDAVSHRDWLTLRDIVEAFGPASFLPLMMVPALLVVSPLSGIPVFSSICGLTIAFIATQLVLNREHVWLPDLLMRRRINGARMHLALERLRGFADWLDRNARDRLSFLVLPPLRLIPELLCVLCGLAMPFLELVPFSSSILGTAVALMAVGFLAADGLFVLFGMMVMSVGLSIPFLIVTTMTQA